MTKYFIGVDVGTNSTRAGVFDQSGRLVSSRIEPIQVYNPEKDVYEQSSDEIWTSVCKCIAHLSRGNNGEVGNNVISIGFDATCSLVVLDANYNPVAVSPRTSAASAPADVIMWMDHRAIRQAEFINSLGLACLSTVGGRISPEMDPPKILWLKQHFKQAFDKAAHFFSLPDYLVWRATRVDARSVCTTTCKWLN